MNKTAAINIIRAQVASDGGKYDSWLTCKILSQEKNNLWNLDYSRGYQSKDYYIRRAIKAIVSSKEESGFRFYVKPDTSRIAKYIIYFNFKIDDKRQQISFHTYGDYSKYLSSGKNFSTRWDHKNSQMAAYRLFKEVFTM